MGRKTYDKVLSMGYDFPHSDKDAYIVIRTKRPTIGIIKFYTGGLPELISNLKSAAGKNIFVDGGAETVHELLKDDLIEEFYISIIPIMLGGGIPLFRKGRPELKLNLLSDTSFEKGLAQLHYVRENL